MNEIVKFNQVEDKVLNLRGQSVILDSGDEKTELVKNFDRFNPLKHSTVLPTAFTERGLYICWQQFLKSHRNANNN